MEILSVNSMEEEQEDQGSQWPREASEAEARGRGKRSKF